MKVRLHERRHLTKYQVLYSVSPKQLLNACASTQIAYTAYCLCIAT